MKKLNLFALVAICMLTLGVSKNVNAQISAGVSGGLGLPMGDFGDKTKMGASMGFGIGALGRYAINDNLHVGAGLGYYMFSGQEIDLGLLGKMKPSYNIIPITASVDYYFMTEGIKPFATLDLGMFNVGGKVELGGSSTAMTAETKFGFGVGAGAAMELNDNMDLFGTVKYNSVAITGGTVSWVGLNVGVSMKFGN